MTDRWFKLHAEDCRGRGIGAADHPTSRNARNASSLAAASSVAGPQIAPIVRRSWRRRREDEVGSSNVPVRHDFSTTSRTSHSPGRWDPLRGDRAMT